MALRMTRPALREAKVSIAEPQAKTADPYYLSAEWKALREATFARDGYRCVVCGAPAKVADHILARRWGGADDLGNLRSLCDPCDRAAKERPDGSRRGMVGREG